MNDGTAAVRKRKLLRGPRRKDDQTQGPQTGEPALQVQLCQIVPMTDDTALLRVTAWWSGSPLVDVAVRLANGNLVTPVAPGAVATRDGLWSAGFEVPPTAVGTEMTLVSAAGVLPLPLPQALAGGPADFRDQVDPTLSVEEQLLQRCELTERELEELRGKLVQAWGEVAQMREAVNGRETEYESAQRRAEQAVAIVDELEARAKRSESEAARLRSELAGREDASALAADLQERFEDLHERFEATRAEADQLGQQLTAARESAHGAMDVATRAARELITERAKVEQATELVERHSERLARLERELEEARAELTAAGERTMQLEAELAGAREALTTAETEVEAMRAQLATAEAAETATQEALEKLEREQTERRHAEAEAANLAERAQELEAALEAERASVEPEAQNPIGTVAVEEDLRHLLATRQRELDEVQAELKDQRARYAAIASKMSPAELAATTETREPENSWSALDDELLDRLARAKELSQQD